MLHSTQLSHGKALALMVFVTFLWAPAGAVSRFLTAVSGAGATFWRSLFALLGLLLIFLWWQGPTMFKRIPWRHRGFWISGVCWSYMFTGYMLSIMLTSVANTLVILATAPFVTALFTRFFLKQPLPERTWFAIGAASAGMVWMFGQQFSLSHINLGSGLGIVLALFLPIAVAAQWTTMQHYRAKDEDLDFMPSILLGTALSCLYTLPLAWPLESSPLDLVLLAGLGWFQVALPCALAVICSRVLAAPEVTLIALLEVIFGVLMAWIIAGETPAPSVFTGGSIVIAAIVFNEFLGWRNLRQQNEVPHRPPPLH